MKIDLEFAEFHIPVFLNGVNWGQKLFKKQAKGTLTLTYDQAEKELIIVSGDFTGIIPTASNVAMMQPTKDAKKWDADRAKLLDYGKNLGFTAEELSQTYDHRAVLALYKAMQYDALMANPPKPGAPRGPRTAAPGSAANAPKPTTEVTKAKQRLARTGKIGDAASLFEAFLD